MKTASFGSRSILVVSALILGACSGDDDSGADAAGTGSATPDAPTTSGAQTSEDGEASTSDTAGPSDTADTSDTSGPPETSAEGESTEGGSGASCSAQCQVDQDCTLNGNDVGLRCSDRGFCHYPCTEPSDCVPAFSGWTSVSCSTNEECPSGLCVDLGDGNGGCATAPSKRLTCRALAFVEVEVVDIQGNDATACGAAQLSCEETIEAELSCVGLAQVCGVDFSCAEPLACGDDNACHCTSDDDCQAADVGDVCNGGICWIGCEDVADCEAAGLVAALDGQVLVCD